MKKTTSHGRSPNSFRPNLERLETRLTPALYKVTSLADSGDGSLRAAITSVNADTTPDEIDFSVAGVIKLTSSGLPAITNTVKIDGTTAPNFAGVPLVELDNNGLAGLGSNAFSGLTLTGSNSTLASLSIVNALGNGVTLEGNNITIVGNYIGLALDGSVAGNTENGLFVDNSTGDTIGGTTAADRNVISGNGAQMIGPSGILIGQPANPPFQQDVTVEGNFIGTDPNGQPVEVGQFNGVETASNGNTIGGLAPGAGNVIAGGTQGVFVRGGSGNAILSNSIFNNQMSNIFLDDGNENQQPPTLFAAIPKGTNTEFSGAMNGQANSAYTIQIFASPQDEGGQNPEGRTFLGTVTVTTDASGSASFTLVAQLPANAGSFITATATSSLGNTSRFSDSIGLSTTPNEAFVASAYGLLLNRAPDPFSTVWVDQLNAGVSTGQVLIGIQRSTEYLQGQVTAMYSLYLERAPDIGGDQTWLNYLQTGGTLEGMAEGLTSSQEYFVLHGSTNQGFVTGLYQDVLNRSAGDAEVAGWEAALDAGASRIGVSSAFLTSQEYRTNLVQADYMTFLLRTADSGGLAAWVNSLNAGATDQDVVAGIFGSPEGYQLWS